ncbi:PREDICTED: mitogen-activated protein kinase kinase kinase MLT-like [Hipposideros armiger]|uniref:Mitogen-activated protein kinase kinase kinase MLT-like n=1 Tax=Hipposideros armiger TaxID=186990 RepID=A0A8B7S9H0_HIPAR|nr:PREDICTED: mitogen-activated protein kinase kinase kinase MLT-like [Hipposideros armiger]
MYMETDGDEIAITYIKDVTFNTNLPDAEILKMTKVMIWFELFLNFVKINCFDAFKTGQPPFVMEKWIVGITENQTVECTVTYETLISVSSAGAECQWLDTLRMRQIASNTSLQRSQSNPILGSQFYPYFSDQGSYAAAVRRTQVPIKYQQITPINQSRSSSPTQYGLTKNFSSLHLNSRDSGFSSLTTDNASESARYSGRSRNKYERGSVSLGSSPRGRYSGKSQPSTPSRERYSGKFYRINQSALNTHQSLDFKRSPNDHHQSRTIPGMPLHPETDPGASEEENKVSEGGWTKVQYRKKPHRPSPAKTNRERARGNYRGRRTF